MGIRREQHGSHEGVEEHASGGSYGEGAVVRLRRDGRWRLWRPDEARPIFLADIHHQVQSWRALVTCVLCTSHRIRFSGGVRRTVKSATLKASICKAQDHGVLSCLCRVIPVGVHGRFMRNRRLFGKALLAWMMSL